MKGMSEMETAEARMKAHPASAMAGSEDVRVVLTTPKCGIHHTANACIAWSQASGHIVGFSHPKYLSSLWDPGRFAVRCTLDVRLLCSGNIRMVENNQSSILGNQSISMVSKDSMAHGMLFP
jgi:hypothetical protein